MLKKYKIFILLLVLMIIIFPLQSSVLADMLFKPIANTYVIDDADLLSSSVKKTINRQSSSLWHQDKAQIIVVTINSLDGQNIGTYSRNLFNAWGIGDSQKDNGILLLISTNDRKVRIQVGYGLADIITDNKAQQIIDDMLSYFRADNYEGGIMKGYSELKNSVSFPIPQEDNSAYISYILKSFKIAGAILSIIFISISYRVVAKQNFKK